MASKMSDPQNVADLMSNPALVGAKAIFDNLASTDWDNLELARYNQNNGNFSVLTLNLSTIERLDC